MCSKDEKREMKERVCNNIVSSDDEEIPFENRTNALKFQSTGNVSHPLKKNDADGSEEENITERLQKRAASEEEAKQAQPFFFYTLKGNGGDQFSFDLDDNRFDSHDLVTKLGNC